MHSSNFFWVGFNSSIRDHKSQKLASSYSKSALRKIEFHLILLEGDKGLLEIFNVGSRGFALDKHVVHIQLHVLSDLILEYFIYEALIIHTYIL